MTEIWKPIPGFEGLYEVSDKGRVKSFCRFAKGQILRPGSSSSGHLSVALGRVAGSKSVHVLVLLAFVGPPAQGMECRHLNGKPYDNRLHNLVWGSRADNIRDKLLHGSGRKLNLKDVRHIKRALKNRARGTASRLAKRFKVSQCTISDIKKGRTHAYVLS